MTEKELKLKKEIEILRSDILTISKKLNTTIGRLTVPAMTMGNKEIKESHQEIIESGIMVDCLFDKLDFMEIIIDGKDDGGGSK